MYSKFFNTLKNTYNFFALYANTDEVDARSLKVKYENLDMEYKLKDVPQLTKDEAARAYKVVVGECDDI